MLDAVLFVRSLSHWRRIDANWLYSIELMNSSLGVPSSISLLFAVPIEDKMDMHCESSIAELDSSMRAEGV